MRHRKSAIPNGLVHLRDGAVAPENAALVRALADRNAGRLGALAALYVFPRPPAAGGEPLLYYFKRVKELSLLAERLAPSEVPVAVTLGDPLDALPVHLLRRSASILYAAVDDPAPDPAYAAYLEGRLRDFDVVEVPGRPPRTLRIPPYWAVGLEAPGLGDELHPHLANRFLGDPASTGSDLERLEVAATLRRILEEES